MILLLINFCLLVSILSLKRQSIREVIIHSYLCLSGISLVFVELLSFFDQISFNSLLICWSSLAVILIIWRLAKYKGQSGIGIRSLLNRISVKRSDFGPEILMVSGIFFILLLTLIIALITPPNNYDSMTYHMARIPHWIQQGNVNYFPTSIPRQNHSMPFAEFQILNLQVLSQGDRYANIIQWSAFLVLILSVSQVTKELGGSKRAQVIAAFFTATLPMAILQSANTQNDILVSLFCILFAYYLIRILRSGSVADVALAGLAMGLALLTKGTAYIYCAAIGTALGSWIVITKLRERQYQIIWKLLGVLVIALILNAGYYQRNLQLYGHPLSTENDRVVVDEISIRGYYATLVRNGMLHLAIPFPPANELVTRLINAHLGSQADHPSTTFPGRNFQLEFLINEDESGNILHFLLISVALFLAVLNWRSLSNLLQIYMLPFILSLVLFSALLKWQPWSSRLQLPIFVLGSALVAVIVERIRSEKLLIYGIILVLFTYSLPYLFLNSSKPLEPIFRNSIITPDRITRFVSNHPYLYDQYAGIISPYYKGNSILYTDRQQQYFTGNMEFYPDYIQVMDVVNQLDEKFIGLYLYGNAWEYPLWLMAERHYSVGQPEFIHVGVQDVSARLSSAYDVLPEYIISTGAKLPGADFTNEYKIIVDTRSIVLLQRR